MAVYRKQVQYMFAVYGDIWAVTHVSERYLVIEETRKNGQEDTHMSAELTLNDDGKWQYEDGREQIEMYESDGMADAILAFFNEHGPPQE